MSICFGCGSKFGLFKREHSCKSCGRVHCSKCLPNKFLLPTSTVEQDICNRCFESLKRTHATKSATPKTAKEDYNQQRVDLPEAPPPYNDKTSYSKAVKSNASPEMDPDAQLRERLANLRQKENKDDTVAHTEENIDDRFEKLTGRQATSAQKSNILTPQPKLSEQEEINRLMEAALAEAKLENDDDDFGNGKATAGEDLENRLLKLKGIDPESVKQKRQSTEYDSSEDEIESTAKAVRKALAEARLDEKATADGYGNLIGEVKSVMKEYEMTLPAVPTGPVSSTKTRQTFKPVESEDDEELPWCCICNSDATLRCHGCDDDLYCKRCYREGHSKYDIEDHETSPFRPKRKK